MTRLPAQRIAVVGAGANGAIVGADLTEAGLDATLIEQWPEHVEMMRADGVTIKEPGGSRIVPVEVAHLSDVATFRAKFDVVLMLMKAYDSRWAAHLIEPHLAVDGLLVGVQNGMTVDVIANVVGYHRTLGCVIEVSSMMFEPGIIERHSGQERSWFGVGALDDAMRGRVDQLAEILSNSGSVEAFEDIRAAKWMKLVSNASTLATSAILGLPIVGAAAIPEMRQLMLEAGREAVAATTSAGFQILPIFGMTLGSRATSADDHAAVVEPMFEWLLEHFVLPDTRTTVLQDWVKGRRSEVDDINGLVASTNRRHGRPSPVNAAVVEVAHRIEQHELEPDPSNFALLLDATNRRGWSPD